MIGRMPDGTPVPVHQQSAATAADNGGPGGQETALPDHRVPWETITQLLGAGAALAAWIAVVGGGRVWAKLHASDIPATQTLAVLPRQLLIVEGLQTLLVPVLLGAGLAALVYFSRRSAGQRTPKASRRWRTSASSTR